MNNRPRITEDVDSTFREERLIMLADHITCGEELDRESHRTAVEADAGPSPIDLVCHHGPP
jgi:hypothetical protein